MYPQPQQLQQKMSFHNTNKNLTTVTVIVLTIIIMNLHFIDGNTNGTTINSGNASNINGYRRNSAVSASNMQTSQTSRERDNKLMSLLAVRRTALTLSQPIGTINNSNSSSSSSSNNNNRWRSRVYNTQNQNLDCAKNCTNNFTVRLSAECIRRCPPMNRNRTSSNRDIIKERDSQNVSVSSSVSISTSSKTSSSSNNNNNSNNNGITHHPKIDELNSIRDELLDMDESSHVLVVNTKSSNDKYPTSIVMHGTKDLSNTNNLYEAEDLKTEFKLLPPSDIGGTSHHHLHHSHHHGPSSAGVFNRTSKYTNIIRSRHKTPSPLSTTSERTTLEESDLLPYFYFGQKLTPTSRHSSPIRSSSSTTTEKPSLIGSASNTNNKFWLANRNQPTNNRNINIVAFNNAQRRAQSAIVSPNITPITLRPYTTPSTAQPTEPTTKRTVILIRPATTTTMTTTTTTTALATPQPVNTTAVQKLIENITSVKIPHPLEINHNLGLLGADDKNDEKRLEQPGIADIFNLTETTERIPVFRIEVTDATNSSSEEAVVITETAPKGMQVVAVENDEDETIVFVNNVNNSTTGTPSTTTSTTSIPTTMLTIDATLNTVDEPDAEEQRTFAPVPDLSGLFPNISADNQTDLVLNATTAPVAEVRTIISSMSSNSSTVQPMNLTTRTTTTTTTTTTTEASTTPSTTTPILTTTRSTITTRKIPIMKLRPNSTTTTTTSTPDSLISTTANLLGLNASLIFPPFLTLPNKDANFTKSKPPVQILNDNGEPLNDTNDVTVEIHRMNMATYVLAGLGMFPIVVILMYVIKTVLFKKKPKVTEDLDRYIQEGQPISPVVRLEQSDTSSIAGDSIVTDRDFDRNKIRFKSLLGEGNFGQVWKAEVDDLAGHLGTTRIVAVKAERSASRQSGLKQEAEIMRKLGSHSNVVTLLGACIEQEPHLLIMEFAMRGRLLSLLRAARNTVSSMSGTINCRNIINPLSPRQLAGFSHDIARGMEYIAEKKIVHRDLAARNILLDHNGICKICDFGMSIDLEKSKSTQPQTHKADFINRQNSHHSPESRFRYDHHHSSGPTRFMANVLNFDRCGKSAGISSSNNNNNNTLGRVRPALPIRWMAPEALQYHIFSVESDVWAFGIIMWEIVTLGCTPYPNLSGREVVRNIPHGTRPEIPHACRPELSELMQRTWRKDPRHRPTFTEARIELGQYLRLWETDENDCTSDYLDVSGFSEDVEHGMVYLNRRISEFECEI